MRQRVGRGEGGSHPAASTSRRPSPARAPRGQAPSSDLGDQALGRACSPPTTRSWVSRRSASTVLTLRSIHPKERVSITSSVVADEIELSFFAMTSQTPSVRAWLRCSHLHDAGSHGRTSGGSFAP